MKYCVYLVLLVLLLTSTSFTLPRKFPSFSYKSYSGESYTEADLMGKTTLAALYHFGCYAAMPLMYDLDSIYKDLDTSKYQIISFLENTEQHISDFYADTINTWSIYRKSTSLIEVSNPIIAECQTENISYSDTNTIIGQHCRKLSKKIHTRDSPTIIYVNPNGRMTKIERGYIALASEEKRIDWLKSFIGLR